MRRFVGLAVLLFFSIPFGLSVVGCGHKAAPVVYCNSTDTGPVVGQVASITLSPTLATVGESLNFAQIGQQLSATAEDCKGNNVSISKLTYASTSSYTLNTAGGPVFADINPSNGQVCGGLWNHNTGGGIADYTICNAPSPLPTVPPAVTLSVPTSFPTITPSSTAGGTTSAPSVQYAIPAAGMLTVQGGTVSSITTTINGVTTKLGVTSGSFLVLPNETVTIAYAAATPASLATVTLAETYSYTASSVGAIQITGGAVSTIYDYAAQTGLTTTVASTSGIFPLQQGDVVVLFYSTQHAAPPTAIFVPETIALVTATADGAVSNAIPVFVHPVVTGIVLGAPTASCSNDPGTDCCPNATTGTPASVPTYTGLGCLSQGQTGQFIGRVYANGGTTPADNITCQVGHLTFSALNAPNVVSIDENGIATANQPGSSIITASVAQSSTASQAGFFSTCAPASIVLSVPGQTTPSTSIKVSINNTQPLTATVVDTKGNPINGLALEFNSTTPQTIPAGNGSITPVFPGAATITAVCQPGTCNPAPFNQIGYNGNGEPLTSNGIDVTTVGTSGTVIYMGSTGSQYILPRDFTTTSPSSLIKLPYAPNSMVISQDGSAIYLGSPQGLMTVATASNSQSGPNLNIPGKVLSVSPSGATVVITDPVRQTVSLYSPTNSAVLTSYGGVATSAQWSPDSNTVYITTTTNTLLTYSAFTNWQPTVTAEPYTDVAVLVPSVGAYFAGGSAGSPTGLTDGRSYCSSASSTTPGNPPVNINTFSPLADENATVVDQIATTNDGKHLLGAHATSATAGPATFTDFDLTINPTTQCTGTVTPGLFQSTPFTQILAGIAPSSITGIVPTSNSTLAFVTYTLSGVTGGGLLPYYTVPSSGAGTLNYLTLGNGATVASAPVSGVVSTDDLSAYIGTSGDDQVHLFSLSGATPTETGVITPNLPAYTGTGYAPINLLVQRPKKTTD